jgi:hypothetical protein
MPFIRKFGSKTIKPISKSIEPINQIEQSMENINLESKSKSKSLKTKVTKELPKINNKSKVSINIPSRKKKITETNDEINLETDDDKD